MEEKFNPERLRPAQYASEPDPRTRMLSIEGPVGEFRPVELDDYFASVSAFALHAGVPDDVVAQFETAKNLYLYAWFVYRFFPIAEHQALTCLELALRKRLVEDIRTGKLRGRKPGLFRLLEYAIDRGLIRNEGFAAWHAGAAIRARNRVEWEKLRQASENNLSEITWDASDIEIKPEDTDSGFVRKLVIVLPGLRNEYAHGSSMLHNAVRDTIRIVSEIVNQLYEQKACDPI